MPNDVATTNPSAAAANLLEVIASAARDPAVDVEKMERLISLQQTVIAREAKTAFDDAMSAMQLDLPVIKQRGLVHNKAGDVQSTFAKWEDISEQIKPVLHRYGFALTFRSESKAQTVKVTGVLSHRAGHREETEMELPSDVSGGKNAVQAMGSSLSYAKRYCAVSLLNITTTGEDNDGAGAAAQRELDFLDAIANAVDGIELTRIKRDMVTSYGTLQKVPPSLAKAHNAKRDSLK